MPPASGPRIFIRTWPRAQLTLPSVVGVALVAAAGLMLLARLPGAYHGFTNVAHAAAGSNELGGALASADSLDLNDDFVRNADALIPKGRRFAVVLPSNEAAVEKADGATSRPTVDVPAVALAVLTFGLLLLFFRVGASSR